ncbi:hypothetical protein LNP74_31575 [Klebsiella pneumoniae subsp. pneumoniae]|nr:hypothetical protein [Klebsiella pneumoniae subsp. pneumoniae]
MAQPSAVPASMPGGGCASPGLHSPCSVPCRPGKRSAARQWAQEMNGSPSGSHRQWAFRAPLRFDAPVAATPYRAYILPAR